ncbi:metallophosphoesterase [Halalkalibacterium ligniniphilum]|uniref:metallophosphoesterase n=1 Tax=Halalkalibacterium ligniniphilum TaxID=1134413 RepID=UPI000558245E|nr:metallophosphoesterase [Halalkalibacterium ligniniphilum]
MIMIILIAFIYKAYRNTKDVTINRIYLEQASRHEYNEELIILQLSDLHLENISISPNELYEKLKDEAIDLIALTGDFLDRKKTIPKLIPYLKVLNQLKPTFGIYAVLGNHDYVLRKNVQMLKDTLQQYGCQVMQNENELIKVKDKHVNLIGIDDFSTKRSNVAKAYTGIKQGTNVVLTHDPNIVLTMKNVHFDYLLAGHFHGGQICYPKAYHLIKMGKLVRMNKIKGLHEHDGKRFYINEGLGQTGVNIRMGSRPEITFHHVPLTHPKIESQPAM